MKEKPKKQNWEENENDLSDGGNDINNVEILTTKGLDPKINHFTWTIISVLYNFVKNCL